ARRHRRWHVAVEPYALARHPVTRGQYYGVLHDAPYRATDEHLPVTDVSWEDAVRFCNRLSTWAGHPPATRSQQTAKHIHGIAPPTAIVSPRRPNESTPVVPAPMHPATATSTTSAGTSATPNRAHTRWARN